MIDQSIDLIVGVRSQAQIAAGQQPRQDVGGFASWGGSANPPMGKEPSPGSRNAAEKNPNSQSRDWWGTWSCGVEPPQPNPSNQHEHKGRFVSGIGCMEQQDPTPAQPHHRWGGALTPIRPAPGCFVVLPLGLVATGWLGTLHDVRRHSWGKPENEWLRASHGAAERAARKPPLGRGGEGRGWAV